MKGAWEELGGGRPTRITVGDTELRPGSRVVLVPKARGDVMDLALAGRVAVVETIEESVEGDIQLTVTVEDDPGRELGRKRMPGHRFFFTPEEVVPVPDEEGDAASRIRILVAGIGNLFLGDDGFGVEVARRLAERELPAGVEVRDFGIRGMDLAYALGEGYDAVVFVDAAPRGEAPGTVSVIEPEIDEHTLSLETHAMDPVRVLRLCRELGPVPEKVLVVACEPLTRMTGDEPEVAAELSGPVAAAVDVAVGVVESLVGDMAKEVTQ